MVHISVRERPDDGSLGVRELNYEVDFFDGGSVALPVTPSFTARDVRRGRPARHHEGQAGHVVPASPLALALSDGHT
jgi:hypothetical protein